MSEIKLTVPDETILAFTASCYTNAARGLKRTPRFALTLAVMDAAIALFQRTNDFLKVLAALRRS